MTDYSKTVDFAAKDALASGNPAKVAKGTEINTELVNIATSIATKYDAGDTVLAGDGVVGTPSIAFNADTNTGIYRLGADTVGFAAGGVLVFNYDSNKQLRATDGTAALPFYTFDSDNDSGMFRAGANDVRISVGGVANLQILTAQVAALVPYTTADGAVGAPAFSFFNDPNTGLYRIGADDLGISAAGTLIAEFVGGSGVGARFPIAIGLFDGVVGTPGMTFTSDSDTGLYRSGTNAFVAAAGGVSAMQWILAGAATQVGVGDGTSAAPSQSFFNDFDTGFYRDTANQIAIALGGVTAGQIAQGSFTLTITGITGTPGVTSTWQRIGNTVVIRTPTLTNAATSGILGLSGIPAAIRPSSQSYGTAAGIVRNGVVIFGYSQVGTGGTATLTQVDGSGINTGTCGVDSGFTLMYSL